MVGSDDSFYVKNGPFEEGTFLTFRGPKSTFSRKKCPHKPLGPWKKVSKRLDDFLGVEILGIYSLKFSGPSALIAGPLERARIGGPNERNDS